MQDTSSAALDHGAAIWQAVREEATAGAKQEPALRTFLQAAVLAHDGLAAALAALLGRKLETRELSAAAIGEICATAFAADDGLMRLFLQDMRACRERDPACRSWLTPLLHYKGLAALEAHRVAHWLWGQGREAMAVYMQSLTSQNLQVDIHPAARLGGGLFMDHATGIVIGETSVVGENVTIFQSVTLGGNGKERGDRHPKVGNGVLISVGAKLLGNIRIGDEARIAASSVVLQDVAPHITVAGVPAKPVGSGASTVMPAVSLDHNFSA